MRATGAGEQVRVHLGLGTNLGDRWAHLAAAVKALSMIGEELVVSPVYETAPVGGPPGQGPYLNCVVRLFLGMGAPQVLELARSLEEAAGRTRATRWGPRTLDVDVLLLERVTGAGELVPMEVDSDELVVPHPRMAERAFVLAPLADVSPGLVESGWQARLGGSEAVRAAVRQVGALVTSLG